MSYGGSSAAGFPEGVKALINYFGYDDGTHIESRGNFTASAWEDLLYNELLTDTILNTNHSISKNGEACTTRCDYSRRVGYWIQFVGS